MTRRSPVTVTTDPGANRYAGPNERIIEFSSPNGGGLILFRVNDDGTLTVEPYRTDGTVTVRLAEPAFYTITDADVGKRHIRAWGRTWPLSGVMGYVQAGDVGKRIYRELDTGATAPEEVGAMTGPGASPTPRYLLTVENDDQRDRRLNR